MNTHVFPPLLIGCILLLSTLSIAQLPKNWNHTPNAGPNTGIDWKNEHSRAQNISMNRAIEIAQSNQQISYFFYFTQNTTLDVKSTSNGAIQKIAFKKSDVVFFYGEPSYKSSSSSDCYIKKKEEKEITLTNENSGQLLNFDNILFQKGTSVIINGTESVIDRVAYYMIKNPAVQIQISGHTDNLGDDKLNIQLSQDRADEVKRLLGMRGISTNRITTKGYGSSQPLNNNSNEEERARNRRIQFRIPKNMILNGGFEEPKLAPNTWNFFKKVPDWEIVAGKKLEIQHRVAGDPIEGQQFAELDGHRNTSIVQEVNTEEGEEYILSFCFAARPDTPLEDNVLEVYWNKQLIHRVGKIGTSPCVWETFQYRVKGKKGISKLEFRDAGTSNSLGTYIDNICLYPALLLEKN